MKTKPGPKPNSKKKDDYAIAVTFTTKVGVVKANGGIVSSRAKCKYLLEEGLPVPIVKFLAKISKEPLLQPYSKEADSLINKFCK